MTTERQNNQEQNKSSDQAEQNKTAQQSNNPQPGNASESPLYGGKGDQGQMDNAVGPERYSYHGPHGNYDPNEGTAPDGYGDQDQFGDVDGQDPYSNLDDTSDLDDASDLGDTGNPDDTSDQDDTENPGDTAGGEGLYDLDESLYGLAEPLAKPGDVSRKGSDKDRFGTRGSQDQYGYQQ